MSRFKLFFLLFFLFAVALYTSVILVENLYQSYQETVLQNELKKDLAMFRKSIKNFTFRKIEQLKKATKSEKLYAALEEKRPQQKKILLYKEFTSLLGTPKFQQASVLLAVNKEGKAFVKTGRKVFWEGEDWSKHLLIKKALKGGSHYQILPFEGRYYVFLSTPIIKSEMGASKGTPQKVAPFCPKEYHLHCEIICKSRSKRTNKCYRYTKEIACSCLLNSQKKELENQLWKKDDAKNLLPSKNNSSKIEIPTNPSIETVEKNLGVLVVGYRFELSMVDELIELSLGKGKKLSNLAFVLKKKEKMAVLATSLSSEQKDDLLNLLERQSKEKTDVGKISPLLKSLQERYAKVTLVSLRNESFLSFWSDLSDLGAKELRMVVFTPVASLANLLKDFMLNVVLLALVLFLVAMVWIFPKYNRFQNELQQIQLKLFESATTGNVNYIFKENMASETKWLAQSLNMLYRRIRGELEPEESPPDAIDWDELIEEEDHSWVEKTQEPSFFELESQEDELISEMLDQSLPETAVLQQKEELEAPKIQEVTERKAQKPKNEKEKVFELYVQMTNEPELYFKNLFQKYQEAKASLGDNKKRDQDSFVARLNEQSKTLKKSNADVEVVYDIIIENKNVIVKPFLIPQ